MLSNTSGRPPYAMNAPIVRIVDDKYYQLLKGLVNVAKVWLSLFHYQVLWQKILILQYGLFRLNFTYMSFVYTSPS